MRRTHTHPWHAHEHNIDPSHLYQGRCKSFQAEADEATYNMHIILRFELEQGLIAGGLEAADVPGVWNEQFTKLLGITSLLDWWRAI